MLSVSIPKRVERTAFSHMVPMLHTGAASWPSGDHILLSFARKVFNSLLNSLFLRLRVTLRGDTKELKKITYLILGLMVPLLLYEATSEPPCLGRRLDKRFLCHNTKPY